jgi:predicted metalloprotease
MSITTLIIIGVVMLLFGVNPLDILMGGPGGMNMPQMPRIDTGSRSPFDIPGGRQQRTTPVSPEEKSMQSFVKKVLADTEDVWGQVFKQFGKSYRDPKLVIFKGATPTACGTGQTAMGPFYCPGDQTVYVDLAFYEELKRRFEAPGDFAQAYVIAHEVGHHVQTLLGISEAVQQKKSQVNEREGNRLQVMMELQADCLAGFWAQYTDRIKNRLEAGDIEEGLRAAAAIGDDMIQRKMTGRVVPDAFTHGTSEQRVRWFKRGLDATDIRQCDTFNASQL